MELEFPDHLGELVLADTVVLSERLLDLLNLVLEIGVSLDLVDDDLNGREDEENKGAGASNSKSDESDVSWLPGLVAAVDGVGARSVVERLGVLWELGSGFLSVGVDD